MSPQALTPPVAIDRASAPDIDIQAACVAACARASTVCAVSANAYLEQEDVADLRACIRLTLDCVDVLGATSTVLSRHFGSTPASVGQLLAACIEAAEACADEVERSAPQLHRQRCVDECRRCARACRVLLQATLPSRRSHRGRH